jgi:hypothetical protein
MDDDDEVKPLYNGNGKFITWGEFKKVLMRDGVKDSTPIGFIDLDGAEARYGVITCYDKLEGTIEVT